MTGRQPGEVVEVFRRGAYPHTEGFETLDDFTGDLIAMEGSMRDEAIGTTAAHELGPADANGIHWL